MITLRHKAGRKAGFSLVDLCVALFLLATSLGALIGSIFYSLKLEDVNEETSAASQRARLILERLHVVDFADIFSAYNSTTADDPVLGTDYLAELQVQEHALETGGKGSASVSFSFPVDEKGWLREDLVDAELGMPRDLNGDGTIDAGNHAGDYAILPLSVRISWEGNGGARTFDMTTVLRGD